MFYALPRRDTNALAHTLLQKFGSLENLFHADAADIARVDGIGEHTAVLIRLIADLYTRSMRDSYQARTKLDSIDAAIRYAQLLLENKAEEQFYVICLDAHCALRHTERLSRGIATETPVYIRHITESVIRSGAAKVIIAHNHPGGSALPSSQDGQTTKKVLQAMNALSIEFLDHIIIGDGDAFSFAEKILLHGGCREEEARIAQYAGRVMQDYPVLFR